MDSQKQQVAERIKQANNILVTVSSNPSVDQLSACISLTLALNKMGKHATAVFSGKVPSTLEFLQPEKTIEKNTDSLRDFIISLDKSKADKLRYKVEDKVVKIFITPYRTSITDKDLDFSQGDFNVDVVVALGVHQQTDLDQAITAHGRILHDATVTTMNVKPGGELGSINWLDVGASSLSELAVELVDMLDKNLLDSQIATAALTGIVAETDRFSNAKTSPKTMSISAELMTAGANQQLVATKLEEPEPVPEPKPTPVKEKQKPALAEPEKDQVSNDGTLEISHDQGELSKESSEPKPAPKPAPEEEKYEPIAPEIHIDETGELQPLGKKEDVLPIISRHSEAPKMIVEPPVMKAGPLTANSAPEQLSPSTDPLTLPPVDAPLLSRDSYGSAEPLGPTILPPSEGVTPTPPAAQAADAPIGGQSIADLPALQPATDQPASASDTAAPVQPDTTLSELEKQLHSEHNAPAQTPAESAPEPPQPPAAAASDSDNGMSELEKARNAVEEAIGASGVQPLQPIQALNAQPVDLQLNGPNAAQPQTEQNAAPAATPAPQPAAAPGATAPNSPPPVPPPMMPPMPPYQP